MLEKLELVVLKSMGMLHLLFVNAIPVICIEYAPLLLFLLTFLLFHLLIS